jgi:hypothetical protein
VPLEEAKDPFLWWLKHKWQFPIFAYLDKTILGILVSQIEMKESLFYCRDSHWSSWMLTWCKELGSLSS